MWELSEDFAVNPARGTIYTSPLSILANRKEWSCVSARFFIQAYKNRGDGLRGLIFNSLLWTQKTPVIFHHLHLMTCFFISTLHPFTVEFPQQNQLTSQI